MTLFVPLEPDSPFPQASCFLKASPDPAAHMTKVVKAIMKARRIAVVCGAGISVQAGIPDFRSSDGLFQSIKRDNPKESLTSGKELFDASVFNSEHMTTLFCQMIAKLWQMSNSASPTTFHHLLRKLDERGKLLRVYTQNIDALESKAGLTFGVPDFEDKRFRSRARNTKGKEKEENPPPLESLSLDAGDDAPSASRSSSPPAEPPRCIPLHGTLHKVHCVSCTHSFPMDDYHERLSRGVPPDCPECTSVESTRAAVGKRPRGVGKLRPSVVLYNEDHKDGEGVGAITQRDLMGGKGRYGTDLLLVVGTSLRVPGTKRIVREFSKAVRSRGGAAAGSNASSSSAPAPSSSSSPKLPTPLPSPRRSPSAEDEAPIKSIYLNLDFPSPKEWESTFDVWLQGDAQKFAELLLAEIDKQERAKAAAQERKERREQEQAALSEQMPGPSTPSPSPAKSEKRTKKKAVEDSSSDGPDAKRKKVMLYVSPPPVPPPAAPSPPVEVHPIRTPATPPHTPKRPSKPKYFEYPFPPATRHPSLQYRHEPLQTHPSNVDTLHTEVEVFIDNRTMETAETLLKLHDSPTHSARSRTNSRNRHSITRPLSELAHPYPTSRRHETLASSARMEYHAAGRPPVSS